MVFLSLKCELRGEAGMCSDSITFSICMDWIFNKVADKSYIRASVFNIKKTDLGFADDAVLLVASLEVLVMVLKVLHEEA